MINEMGAGRRRIKRLNFQLTESPLLLSKRFLSGLCQMAQVIPIAHANVVSRLRKVVWAHRLGHNSPVETRLYGAARLLFLPGPEALDELTPHVCQELVSHRK